MITLETSHAALTAIRADICAWFVPEDARLFHSRIRYLTGLLGKDVPRLDTDIFTGKEYQTLLLFPRSFATRRLLLVGAGKAEKLTLEKLRRLAATAAKSADTMKVRTLAIFEPPDAFLAEAGMPEADRTGDAIGAALAEGAVLSLYRYDRYISDRERKAAGPSKIIIAAPSASREAAISGGISRARVLCEATWLARDLENAPGNEIYPATLARRAGHAGRRAGFRVTVLTERRIRRLGMGGLEGVSRGSARPPRFIIMEHNRGASRHGTVVLVGKGVTFDSGGISIKPSANMSEMKMDMSGAAAVIGTMQAAARLRLPVRLIGLVPATENLPGGRALKPGDIITHLNGKTSEVDNTDAEGRLILADALAYAARFAPDLVVDLATLTGACVVALGHVVTGMMGNTKEMMARLQESGERTYERVWELPMFEEYERLVRSDVADVKNVGGRWAGDITAAMFLKKFTGKYRWIHLDIAGTAIMEESTEYIPKGGSGVGVRLLIDFLRHWKKP